MFRSLRTLEGLGSFSFLFVFEFFRQVLGNKVAASSGGQQVPRGVSKCCMQLGPVVCCCCLLPGVCLPLDLGGGVQIGVFGDFYESILGSEGLATIEKKKRKNARKNACKKPQIPQKQLKRAAHATDTHVHAHACMHRAATTTPPKAPNKHPPTCAALPTTCACAEVVLNTLRQLRGVGLAAPGGGVRTPHPAEVQQK